MNVKAWDVVRRERVIDTVFYTEDCDEDYVRDSLISHDGYPWDIEVFLNEQFSH